MLKIKSLTLKNFLSIGNITQSVSFNDSELYLIIGENLDLGGNDNRNGVGKTTIINGLSYALYGKPLVSIKLENLINKTNGKKMYSTIEFEQNGKSYRIERGRKPTTLKFFINNEELNPDTTNEAQGENRLTQQEIERVLGISHDMFKMIIALNTYTEPFLSMKAADQRDIIEQLLGVTKLSEKAENLKELLRNTKESIKEEEFKINAIKEANKRFEDNIKSQERRSTLWDKQHKENIENTVSALDTLLKLDIDEEIKKHNKKAEVKEQQTIIESYKRDRTSYEGQLAKYKKREEKVLDSLKSTADKKCPTCGQDLHEEHEHLTDNIKKELKEIHEEIDELDKEIKYVNNKVNNINIEKIPETFYDDIADAYNHKSSIQSLESALEKERASENPYIEGIKNLKENGLQKIDYQKIEKLNSTKDHQEFLLKLLTNKDSFIRRRIINQNLAYLNKRMSFYLVKMGLPHQVKFQSDLTTEIQEHGRDLDFDNLSRGERTRLILSMSWAFRDVFEHLNDRINLLFIDELVDNGLDVNGVEAALSVLKRMTRDNKRCVHLISHRDELMGRVDNVLKVIKEGGFTAFDLSEDI